MLGTEETTRRSWQYQQRNVADCWRAGRKMAHLIDRILICSDCGQRFTFSVGEQQFFTSKQLSSPKRCPDCRFLRRKSLNPDPGGGGDE